MPKSRSSVRLISAIRPTKTWILPFTLALAFSFEQVPAANADAKKATPQQEALHKAAAQPVSHLSKPTEPTSPSLYVVGPDDILNIGVLKHPEFSLSQAVIPQNGLLTLPVVGTIRVTGKTLERLDAEITQGFKVRLRQPEITVTLARPRPRPIYIEGTVTHPGIFEAKNNWHITQGLAAAGGLAVQSDLAAVMVNRDNRTLLDTPLLPLLKDPTNPKNLSLRSGDSLRFYERKVTVSVTGAVTVPGVYGVPIGNGVVQAVGLAGGPLPAAALTKATIRRANGQIVPVNLFKALLENDTTSNLPLVEGDVIVIPEQDDRISVLGAVEKAGFFSLQDGRDLKVADAVALAGGPARNAALTHAVLRHGNGDEQPLNLYSVLIQGIQTDNVVLRPNDIISIPEARGVTLIGEVGTPGSFPLEEGKAPRVADALAVAGGLRIKPELAKISVARTTDSGKLTSFSIDPIGLLELSDPAQNMLIRDGDIVSVSSIKRNMVFVSGEVKVPGQYDLSEGDGVTELISRAGGPTPDGSLSRVTVTRRDGSMSTVNTVAAFLEGGNRVSLPLHDGDIVVVPRSSQRVLVVGAVGKAGSYPMPEDRPLTVGDALTLAGGAAYNAKSVTLLRPNGKEVVPQYLRIDRPENGILNVNLPIQPGDVLYVPEGKVRQNTLQSIYNFIPGVQILSSLLQ